MNTKALSIVSTAKIDEKRKAKSRASSSILEFPDNILAFSFSKKFVIFSASEKSLRSLFLASSFSRISTISIILPFLDIIPSSTIFLF